MNILSEEFEESLKIAVRTQFKESFTEFLEHESSDKGWLSLESAAKHADCSSNTIRKWIRMGLNLYQIDGTKRVKKAELDEFIESHVVI
ncbi:helix-turn-helix domain-containing protein [Streptococcus danieliae]|uniref:helix-turn-helix domain-containing protein n=1 Tax=Streptococcus danieliae TaxID=747656 RepID=UPI0021C8A3B9|nr:helix-turn-helix domain-containing protein [Streptococcus danieliae]MCU0082621.1 helix-turn-helix domain-containing protein [Streptococcus danieliae]